LMIGLFHVKQSRLRVAWIAVRCPLEKDNWTTRARPDR